MNGGAELLLRLVAGAIFFAQGWRKVVSAPDAPHGRMNLEGLIARRRLPRPDLLAWVVGLTELVGGAALLVGLFTRVATLPLSIILVAAIVGYKWEQGFLGGWDWPFSVLGIVLAITLLGAGPISLDAVLRIP